MCKCVYTVPSRNTLLKSLGLLFLFINTSSEGDYSIICLAIGSEENNVTFYLKSETDSYYILFSNLE